MSPIVSYMNWYILKGVSFSAFAFSDCTSAISTNLGAELNNVSKSFIDEKMFGSILTNDKKLSRSSLANVAILRWEANSTILRCI
ncbi:hypothetical protein ES705_50209 [subsurface metagenome]